MEDCTRLDVVRANLRKDPIKNNIKKKIFPTKLNDWNDIKKDIGCDAWSVAKNSLELHERTDLCSLDVSITFEKKIMKYVKDIKFNLSDATKREPKNLSKNLVSELNTISSLASKLAQKISNDDVIIDQQNINNEDS